MHEDNYYSRCRKCNLPHERAREHYLKAVFVKYVLPTCCAASRVRSMPTAVRFNPYRQLRAAPAAWQSGYLQHGPVRPWIATPQERLAATGWQNGQRKRPSARCRRAQACLNGCGRPCKRHGNAAVESRQRCWPSSRPWDCRTTGASQRRQSASCRHLRQPVQVCMVQPPKPGRPS